MKAEERIKQQLETARAAGATEAQLEALQFKLEMRLIERRARAKAHYWRNHEAEKARQRAKNGRRKPVAKRKRPKGFTSPATRIRPPRRRGGFQGVSVWAMPENRYLRQREARLAALLANQPAPMSAAEKRWFNDIGELPRRFDLHRRAIARARQAVERSRALARQDVGVGQGAQV